LQLATGFITTGRCQVVWKAVAHRSKFCYKTTGYVAGKSRGALLTSSQKLVNSLEVETLN